ncbi:MAG: dienelactone hydrolase family protein [Gammaproteobacteria bacterium]|nr:MAG: dienelactone hydrolase family protein [Gammaproteobacteria bacterium]
MFRLITGSLLLLLSITVNAAISGKEVSYQAGAVTLKGYLATDTSLQGKRPGILVVHEWWGHNAYARKRAEMLAALGYTALAVDMYGDGKMAKHPDDAGKFAGVIRKDPALMKARFMAALEFLNRQPGVDAGRTAAIGYCFGGGVVLEMARQGVDLDGVVSFHGSLGGSTTPEKGAIRASVLVLNGAADPFVTAEQIAAFRAEMDAAGADYTFINYPGVKHSFTNPEADQFGKRFDLPLAYDAEADASSWQAMQELFVEIFSQ